MFFRWLTLCYIVFLSALVLLADEGRAGVLFGLVELLPGGDKTGHFLLMGTLSFLVSLSARAARHGAGSHATGRAGLIVAAVVSLEELSQLLFVARSFSLGDLMADWAGIYLGARLALARRGGART